MPRYYFECFHRNGVIHDPDGMELESDAAAHAFALVSISEIQQDSDDLAGAKLDVKDERGRTLFSLPFAGRDVG